MSNVNKNASGQQNQDWDNKQNQTGNRDRSDEGKNASQQGRMDENKKSGSTQSR